MAISCTYCGGSHANPAEVRACWQRKNAAGGRVAPAAPQSPTRSADHSGADRPRPQPGQPQPPRQPASRPTTPRRPADSPGSLGRRPGSSARPPADSPDDDRRGIDELRDLGLLPPFPDQDPGDEYVDGGGSFEGGFDDYVPPGDDWESAPVASRAPRPAAAGRRPSGSTSTALDLSGVSRRNRAAAHPGPDELGRNLILGPASAEAVASDARFAAWSVAPTIVIDGAALAAPAGVLSTIAERAATRERTIFELHVDFDDPPASVDHRPLHEVGARFIFELDRLHHLVWSNSLDGRGREGLTWGVLDEALAIGTVPAPSTDGTGGEQAGDVVLGDGRAAWLDGGPVAIVDLPDGLPIVHRIAIEHRSLTPLGTNVLSGVELAPDQLAAVTHPGGAARIIAPAGSGKTRVLTERARHLFDNWHVPTGAVSLVAFNVRAQNEMRERTTDLPGLQVRTLNAIALAIVNGSAPFAPQAAQRRTIDERDVRSTLDRLVDFPRRRNTDPVGPWIEALSMARLGLRSPAKVEASFSGDVAGFTDVFPRYRAALERQGWVDFDEQIYRALEILLTDPSARSAAQRASRLLLVDEFQDLTPAHLLLVRLLASPDLAVFGVGDDDQTIYGYNGADPASLIEFATLFPGAGDHPLEVNYRCRHGVVEIADRLLRHNRRRVSKTIRAADAESVGWSVASNGTAASSGATGRSGRSGTSGDTAGLGEGSLANTIAAVVEAVAAGHKPADIAVLCRVNALLAPVQVGLQVAGIPSTGGVGSEFIERTAVRSTLAWLRLAAGFWFGDDLGEALRRPSRPLHPNVTDWVKETKNASDLSRLANRLRTPRDAERVEAFGDDIAALRDLAGRGASTQRVLETLFRKIGLANSVSALDAGRHGTNKGAQDDDLTALTQLAALQPDPTQFPTWLASRFDRSVARAAPGEGVTLSTVHRVKGQEWPVIVVHEASATQFPHRLAEDLEEERRLFHVAITRASEQVTIVTGDDPSPFVEELTTEPTERTVNYLHREASADKPTRTVAPGASTLSDKTAVIAVAGLVLSDQGTEWRIEAVDESGATARSGATTRRFAVGTKIGTAGGRNGKLRLLTEADPSAAIVRADDGLRRMRRLVAAGKPAYTVFDDATIERLALAMPTSLETLARIQGIGPVKLERYGDAVLLAIEDAINEPGQSAAYPDPSSTTAVAPIADAD